jgi:UDP-glucose:(glucosyl)LPS beta-1,3-glucosyltransferase
MRNGEISNRKTNNWVSVIMPTYNRAGFIAKALDSVWRQTYRPIELLIVDDGSTDATKSVILDWANTHDRDNLFVTKYIYQKNSGAPSARNNGVKNATGRYLQFLDFDDLLLPDKLYLQMNLIKREKTPLCICDHYHVDSQGHILRIAKKNLPIECILKEFAAVHHTSGLLIDSSFIKGDLLKWNENITMKQDKDFFLKILMVIDEMSYVNEYLFKWVRHSDVRISNTVKEGRKINWDLMKSLMWFNIKHLGSISYKKIIPLVFLYKDLLRRSLAIGPFTKSLKSRKHSAPKGINEKKTNNNATVKKFSITD